MKSSKRLVSITSRLAVFIVRSVIGRTSDADGIRNFPYAESEGELILYNTDDGAATVGLRAIDGTVWLTQLEMADLFDSSKQNISLHLDNILSEGELAAESVVKESLTTAADGKAYRTKVCNLDAIPAVGYRVRSPRSARRDNP